MALPCAKIQHLRPHTLLSRVHRRPEGRLHQFLLDRRGRHERPRAFSPGWRPLTATALLAESANSHQLLELRPSDAVSPFVGVRITSWCRGGAQVRIRTLMAPEAVLGLKNAVQAVLARSGVIASRAEG